MKAVLLAPLLLAACGSDHASDRDAAATSDGANPSGPDASTSHALKTVFLIVMENKNWAHPAPDPVLVGNPSAPYINMLIRGAAHAENYRNPPGEHPSPSDYVWLESGADFGITSEHDPSPTNSVATTAHLTDLLEDAGISWRGYLEGIEGGACPMNSHDDYASRHVPFLFFRDIGESDARCAEHLVPYSQLAVDLAARTQPRYSFIVPDLCHDMHGHDDCGADHVANGDAWLATNVPMIMSSPAYLDGDAVIFIVWDESVNGEYPIGMIAVSPDAKPGYASTARLSHSSTVRTLEEIFDVHPLLGDAANAKSLGELFRVYP